MDSIDDGRFTMDLKSHFNLFTPYLDNNMYLFDLLGHFKFFMI